MIFIYSDTEILRYFHLNLNAYMYCISSNIYRMLRSISIRHWEFRDRQMITSWLRKNSYSIPHTIFWKIRWTRYTCKPNWEAHRKPECNNQALSILSHNYAFVRGRFEEQKCTVSSETVSTQNNKEIERIHPSTHPPHRN